MWGGKEVGECSIFAAARARRHSPVSLRLDRVCNGNGLPGRPKCSLSGAHPALPDSGRAQYLIDPSLHYSITPRLLELLNLSNRLSILSSFVRRIIEMNEILECSAAISGRKPLRERARFARPQNDMTTGAFVLTLILVAVLVAPYTDHPLLWSLVPFGLVAAGTAVKTLFKPESAAPRFASRRSQPRIAPTVTRAESLPDSDPECTPDFVDKGLQPCLLQ